MDHLTAVRTLGPDLGLAITGFVRDQDVDAGDRGLAVRADAES